MPISDEERLKRLEDSHSELKEGQLKMEYAMDTLITKVSDMADGIGVMSKAVSDNAATSEVVKRIEDEIIENRQSIRKLEERYDDKLDDHVRACDVAIKDLDTAHDTRGKERLTFALKMAFGATSALWAVTTLLFAYLYMDARKATDDVKEVSQIIQTIPVELEKVKSKITVLDQKIKYCNQDLEAFNE